MLEMFAPIAYLKDGCELERGLGEAFEALQTLDSRVTPATSRKIPAGFTHSLLQRFVPCDLEPWGAEPDQELVVSAQGLVGRQLHLYPTHPALFGDHHQEGIRRAAIERHLAAFYYLEGRYHLGSRYQSDPSGIPAELRNRFEEVVRNVRDSMVVFGYDSRADYREIFEHVDRILGGATT
jgi:hypothetical protein